MLIGELLRVAWKAVTAHKLRSFLTLLGVIIGVMTVVAVVAVISGLNNYVATKIFSLSPDVYAVTRWGIITSREEFLEALKRKPLKKPELEQVMRLAKTAEKIGASLRDDAARRVREPQALGRPDLRHDGEHGGDPEPRPRVRALLHGAGERAPRVRRRHRLGRAGTSSSRASTRSAGRSRSSGIPFEVIGLLAKQGSVLGQSQDNDRLRPARDALQGLGREPRTSTSSSRRRAACPASPRPWTRCGRSSARCGTRTRRRRTRSRS